MAIKLDERTEHFVRDDPITQRAMESTGLSFEDLISGVSIDVDLIEEPHMPGLSWPISWPAGLFDIKHMLDVHDFAVLAWFYSYEAQKDQYEDHRAEASERITKAEYAMGWANHQRHVKRESEQQRDIARRKRNPVKALAISKLAPYASSERNVELWNRLVGILDEEGLNRVEGKKNGALHMTYEDYEGKTKSLTEKAFGAWITEARKIPR